MPDLQGAKPWQGPAGWIDRLQEPLLRQRLEQFPAVAVLGPRQVGKTTLALQLAASTPSLHLDLEAECRPGTSERANAVSAAPQRQAGDPR